MPRTHHTHVLLHVLTCTLNLHRALHMLGCVHNSFPRSHHGAARTPTAPVPPNARCRCLNCCHSSSLLSDSLPLSQAHAARLLMAAAGQCPAPAPCGAWAGPAPSLQPVPAAAAWLVAALVCCGGWPRRSTTVLGGFHTLPGHCSLPMGDLVLACWLLLLRPAQHCCCCSSLQRGSKLP